MAPILQARDERDVLAAVGDAVAAKRPLEIVGHGSRRGLGRPTEADGILDLSALSGVTLYEPNELVLTAKAATPLRDLEALLAAHDQRLAFEPPDFGTLWGRPEGLGTIGGAVSVGFGGPRRPSAGAARDHLLGFKAVNGFAEAFAGGGRVVKNVTGYDVSKLMAGAFGTLGVLTEVTLKVLPGAPAAATVIIAGLEEAAGLKVLRDAYGSPSPVTGAAYLPAEIAARLDLAVVGGRSATLLRLEGVSPAISAAAADLCALHPGRSDVLAPEAAAPLWRAIGGASVFAGSDTAVWRVCAPPAAAPGLAEALRSIGAASLYHDWGGGLLWVEGPESPDGGAKAIREALQRVAGEGHATLVRRSTGMDVGVEPFQPLAPGVANLTRRIKAQFDPAGIFNPGRMQRDW